MRGSGSVQVSFLGRHYRTGSHVRLCSFLNGLYLHMSCCCMVVVVAGFVAVRRETGSSWKTTRRNKYVKYQYLSVEVSKKSCLVSSWGVQLERPFFGPFGWAPCDAMSVQLSNPGAPPNKRPEQGTLSRDSKGSLPLPFGWAPLA